MNDFERLPPFVAELSVALWFVVKGVDLEKWRGLAHDIND